jgi:hypothetical protein
VLVIPRKDKNFAQFQQDDANCRQFASAHTGGTSPAEAATASTATNAVVGTVLGVNAGAYSAASLHQRYDMSYIRCMAANGDQVPQPTGGGYSGYYSPYAYAYPYPYSSPMPIAAIIRGSRLE